MNITVEGENMSKLTPRQRELQEQITEAGAVGLAVDTIRGVAASKTLDSLVRRGLVTISFGRAYRRRRLGPALTEAQVEAL